MDEYENARLREEGRSAARNGLQVYRSVGRDSRGILRGILKTRRDLRGDEFGSSDGSFLVRHSSRGQGGNARQDQQQKQRT